MKKILLFLLVVLSISSVFAKDRGPVVATVNGEPIYQDSVNFLLKNISDENIEKNGGKEKVSKNLIDQLVAAEALKQAALNSDISKDETFKKLLKIETDKMVQEFYLQREVEKRVSESDIKDAYAKAKKEFKPQNEYHVFNILTSSKKEAEDVIAKLQKGADFKKLAKETSLASNAKETSGDLGFVTKDLLIDEVANVVSSLKAKSFAKNPVKSPFGWNVFYLEEVRKQTVPSYDNVKESIKNALYKQEMLTLVKEIKNKAKVEIK